MQQAIKKNTFLILGLFFIFFFFNKVFIGGLLPIPTDNIVGLYHPYRDFYSKDYPRGIPFQNSLVTDPVRQQYLWRELAISQMKKGELPLWNPYNFSGYPLLANFQSAVFYPLNLAMFILPFEYGWTLLIISQPLLAFIFMFLYLRNLKISKAGSFIGSIAFAFSGFFVSWMLWGNIVSTGLWLPLVLLAIDKVVQKTEDQRPKTKYVWSLIFVFSLVASFFAGYLQIFFYLFIISFVYLIFRCFEYGRKIKRLVIFIILYVVFLILTSIQWIPTLQLVNLSARSVDQVSTNIEGWFIPWQNLVQFIAPDFFGNPATLNYWGVWNYGEFVGYIGLLPLILALGVLIFKRDKLVLFFGFILTFGVIFAFPSVISNLPFWLDIPLVSTSQPTRLMYVVNFSLVILAAFGFDYFMKNKNKIFTPLITVGVIYIGLWTYVKFDFLVPEFLRTDSQNLAVVFSNLRFPSIIFLALVLLFITNTIFSKKLKNNHYQKIILGLVLLVFLIDIFRFADKYTVFSDKKYLYPNTKSLDFIQNQSGNFRIMETDSRILPPNFTINYRLESIDGYDPLYLMRYAELAAAIGRNEPNINPPFGFNRIITLQNYQNEGINILNVGYVLSLAEIDNNNYEKVFEEGETKIYKNNNSIDKAFFVERTIGAENKYDSIEKLYEQKSNLGKLAIIEDEKYNDFNRIWTVGKAEVVSYEPNRIVVNVESDGDGFLVLTDSFYPTWRVEVDGVSSEILRANYNFRGVVVSAGSKEVIFTNHLF
jgi:hypothetical protein